MTTRPKKKPTHGGARAGSGRKAKPDRKRPLSVWVSPAVIDYLSTVDNKSLTVEEAVRSLPNFPTN